MDDYRTLTIEFGNRFIAELNEPSNYKVCITSAGNKYMNITDTKNCETIVSIGAPTYRALFEAVRDAWALHCTAKRGF